MRAVEAWVGIGGVFWGSRRRPHDFGGPNPGENRDVCDQDSIPHGVAAAVGPGSSRDLQRERSKSTPACQRPTLCSTALWRHLAGHEK
jgi:hypothetical protein